MEWVKPIDQVEEDFRRLGVFILVDMNCKRLKLFGYNRIAMLRLTDELKGRSREMADLLIARARVHKGETT
jgi:hypothetical protein